MTKDEALDLALEVLEYIDLCDNDRDFLHPHECFQLDKAIAAIKQARSAPVQEPVAWMDASGDIYKHELWPDWNPPHTPLYTTPLAAQQDIQRLTALVRAQQITIDKLEAQRQFVGLTEGEIEDIWYHAETGGGLLLRFAQAIEAKLKEKNGM